MIDVLSPVCIEIVDWWSRSADHHRMVVQQSFSVLGENELIVHVDNTVSYVAFVRIYTYKIILSFSLDVRAMCVVRSKKLLQNAIKTRIDMTCPAAAHIRAPLDTACRLQIEPLTQRSRENRMRERAQRDSAEHSIATRRELVPRFVFLALSADSRERLCREECHVYAIKSDFN